MRIHYAVKRNVNTNQPGFDHLTRFVRALVTINIGQRRTGRQKGRRDTQRIGLEDSLVKAGTRAIFGRGRPFVARHPFLLSHTCSTARAPMFRRFSCCIYGERSYFRKYSEGSV